MFRSSRILALSFVLLTVFTTGCFGSNKAWKPHASKDGTFPESYLPGELGLVLSYSSRMEGQKTALDEIEAQLGDAGRLGKSFSENIDTQLQGSGLDYEKDLLPALGASYRVVFASKEESAFSAITLEDSAAMVKALDSLVQQNQLTRKTLGSTDAYVNEEGRFYAALDGDILLVSSTAEDLTAMLDQKKADSLWENENYQDALKAMGPNHVVYAVMFPAFLAESAGLPTGVSALPEALQYQAFVARAEADGLGMEVFVQADGEKAKNLSWDFSAIPRSKPYLFKEVPSDDLMVYMESYGLRQSMEQAQKIGDDTGSFEAMNQFFKNYFSADFNEEILSFLGKAYVFSAHQNGDGALPGLSLFVDVSEDVEDAKAFADKLDAQIGTLSLVFQTALPGAVSKETVKIDGEDLSTLVLDFSKLSDPALGASTLPPALTAKPIRLSYGLLGERFLITTAEVWSLESSTPISDGELYNSLKGRLAGADEGLILVDMQGVVDFMETLRTLRSDLSLGVPQESLDLEGLLKGFSGAIFASETKGLESHIKGFMMLAQ
jgi:hypothetical protein